jgi:hypothetical protein
MGQGIGITNKLKKGGIYQRGYKTKERPKLKAC